MLQKEITSKPWVWFIRAWMTIPFLFWIPHFIAFFYPDRPSEAHFMFWLIVCFAEIAYYFWFVKDMLGRKVVRATLKTIVPPLLISLMILPGLRNDLHLSVADNHDNHLLTTFMILTILPMFFFGLEPKKTASPSPSR